MNRSKLRRPRLARAFGSLGAFLIVSASSGRLAAQAPPSIGLTAYGGVRIEEVGEGHYGPGSADYFGWAVAAGDFDGDGRDDLAVGAPGNDCDFVVWDCGVVQVRFGAANGAWSPPVVLDPELQPLDPAVQNEEYGAALAAGDFNGDGHDDLVVGVPNNRALGSPVGNFDGAVQVHYGGPPSPEGIQLVAEHVLRAELGGFPAPASGDHYAHLGIAVAVGDFNADGHDDVAIGDSLYSFAGSRPSAGQAGRVFVAHGHLGGLVPYEGFAIEQGLHDVADVPEDGELFGRALAAGDFNGDGYDDLAIGVVREDDVGAVQVVYGSVGSLVVVNAGGTPDPFFFGHIDLGIAPRTGSRFGAALAAGDFNHDGFDDLVVGAPDYDNPGGPADIGLVSVVYGTPLGLSTGSTHLWQGLLHGPGHDTAGDRFGSALAAGDFDGDGVDDLAIGADGDDHNIADAGGVTVLRGRPGVPLGGAARLLYPFSFNLHRGMIRDHLSSPGRYGFALAAADFDGNGFDDLAIGAPFRDDLPTVPDPRVDAGAVMVLFGQLFVDGFEIPIFGEWSTVVP